MKARNLIFNVNHSSQLFFDGNIFEGMKLISSSCPGEEIFGLDTSVHLGYVMKDGILKENQVPSEELRSFYIGHKNVYEMYNHLRK
jgi:hypothetical protein